MEHGLQSQIYLTRAMMDDHNMILEILHTSRKKIHKYCFLYPPHMNGGGIFYHLKIELRR